MLAWLYFCIQHNLSYQNHHSAPRQPSPRGSTSISLEKTLSKLLNLQRHDEQPSTRSEMLQTGSQGWKAMPEEFRHDIAATLQLYTEERLELRYREGRTQTNDPVASSPATLDKDQMTPAQADKLTTHDPPPKTMEPQH